MLKLHFFLYRQQCCHNNLCSHTKMTIIDPLCYIMHANSWWCHFLKKDTIHIFWSWISLIWPISVTVSLLWESSRSDSTSFSDSESCLDILVLFRLPARRMDDSEPPFFTRKLLAPLICSSREPPIRIFLIGAEEKRKDRNKRKPNEMFSLEQTCT